MAEAQGNLPLGGASIIQQLVNLGNSSTVSIFLQGVYSLQNLVYNNPAYNNTLLSGILNIAANSALFWNGVTDGGPSLSIWKIIRNAIIDAAGSIGGASGLGGLLGITVATATGWGVVALIAGAVIGGAGATMATSSLNSTFPNPTNASGNATYPFSFISFDSIGYTHNRIVYQTLNDHFVLGINPPLTSIQSQVNGIVSNLESAGIIPVGSSTAFNSFTNSICSAPNLVTLTTNVFNTYTSAIANPTFELTSYVALLSIANFGNMFWQQALDSGTGLPLALPQVQARILWDLTGFARGLQYSSEAVYEFNQLISSTNTLTPRIFCGLAGSIAQASAF